MTTIPTISNPVTSIPAEEETLEQLVARLPLIRSNRNAIAALELGEFRFVNGDSLAVYVGGVRRDKEGDRYILYSPGLRTVRGKLYLGLNRHLGGPGDYSLNCSNSLPIPQENTSNFRGITSTDNIIERRDRHLSSLRYHKIKDIQQQD